VESRGANIKKRDEGRTYRNVKGEGDNYNYNVDDNSFILFSVLQKVHNTFQYQFSTERNLMPPFSIYKIFSFPQDLPIASYFFFNVLPSLLFFPLSFLQ